MTEAGPAAGRRLTWKHAAREDGEQKPGDEEETRLKAEAAEGVQLDYTTGLTTKPLIG